MAHFFCLFRWSFFVGKDFFSFLFQYFSHQMLGLTVGVLLSSNADWARIIWEKREETILA